MNIDRVILGIDPGTTTMGYGIIHAIKNKITIEALGVIELSKYTDHYSKLRKIFERTLAIVEQYKPDEMALEAPFYGKNVQSMLKLGRAQGVAMAAGLYRQVPIFEYSPRKIKQAITGNGNASKEQVAGILKNILKIKEMPIKLDATDGLAAAVCHFYQKDVGQSSKSYSGWGDFVKKNPNRIS